MRTQLPLIIMLSAGAAFAQARQSAPAPVQTTQMATPPPVSGLSYATQVGSEVQRNYLRGGLTYSTSYVDNFYANSGNPSVAETTISILPTLALDASSARQHATVTYSPGFTLFYPSNALNEVDHTAAVNYEFRLTPHATVSAMERFQDSSSPYFPSDEGIVSGVPVSTTPGAVPPFAKRLTNFANAEITMQTGLNDMVGASGISTVLHYPNTSQTPGLFDSNSFGGTAFYNHRLSGSQYVGATYQYLDMLTYPAEGETTTTTSTVMGFYTIYPSPKLSLSVSGGPQYYRVGAPLQTPLSSWVPSEMGSIGWQGDRTSFAASYSQSVTGAGGLLGAYHTGNANASMRWRLARTWTAGVSGTYAINKSVGSTPAMTAGNGHTLAGSASLQHPIRGQVSLAFNYERAHQSYGQVPVIAANPDSDRVSVAITWNFMHPLGN